MKHTEEMNAKETFAMELRSMTNHAKFTQGEQFANEYMKVLKEELKKSAAEGKSELRIDREGKLNEQGWLSKPHYTKPIVKQLEKLGLNISHNDDVRDGTYIIIKW